MNVLELSGWDGPGTRAGSLYAVPAGDRLAAARQLAAAGWWIHVDVMSDASGVTAAELAQVREAVPAARIEVHVIDLGARHPLTGLLEARPDRVVLSPARCGSEGAAVRACGAELWVEGHGGPLPADLRAPGAVDGVLVMLIDPGTTQSIDLDRLDGFADLPAELAVGVDGGVRPQHVTGLVRTGVRHLVSGRALLSQQHSSTPSPHEQESHR